MKIVNYNNRNCLKIDDEPFQLLIVAESGHGKGMSSEAIMERWKRITGGIVICVNDPKQENEQFFVQYEPEELYHLKDLKRDGIRKAKYPVKLYHPFSFELSKKGFLPPMTIFTLSIKDLVRGDWSILAETDAETETIKLLERVSEYLPRNYSLFDFLLEIERLTEGKKIGEGKRDKNNWGLKPGGGTAKSIRQIGNMLSSFQKNYFLRKDTCPYKLNWDEILLDPTPYHLNHLYSTPKPFCKDNPLQYLFL